jgi:hypothetical protein
MSKESFKTHLAKFLINGVPVLMACFGWGVIILVVACSFWAGIAHGQWGFFIALAITGVILGVIWGECWAHDYLWEVKRRKLYP